MDDRRRPPPTWPLLLLHTTTVVIHHSTLTQLSRAHSASTSALTHTRTHCTCFVWVCVSAFGKMSPVLRILAGSRFVLSFSFSRYVVDGVGLGVVGGGRSGTGV